MGQLYLTLFAHPYTKNNPAGIAPTGLTSHLTGIVQKTEKITSATRLKYAD
ncbi:MAG: hypothetical protein FWC80_07320 [Firmicutes bacterium]|nr:hypothetical protein [Bacillota bacterium]